MINKKRKIFLWLSMILFIMSVIILIASTIATYFRLKTVFQNDKLRIMNEFVLSLLICALTMIPCIGSEASFIRSVYKILKYRPVALVRICYIVSASLTFIVSVFQWLVFVGLIDLEKIGSSENFEITVLLLIGWPIFIISFFLGSIPIKHRG